MKKAQLLPLLIIALFIGCVPGIDEPSPDDDAFEGTYEMKLTGEANETLKGTASFLHAIATSKSKEENGSTVLVTLSNKDETIGITILMSQQGDLDGIDSGTTFTIETDPEDGDPIMVVGMSGGAIAGYYGTSGSAKLSKVENKKIVGTINVTLVNGEAKTITMTGDFEAFGITQKI